MSFRTAVEFLVLSFWVRVNPVTRQLLIKRQPVKKGRKVLKRGKERRNERTIHKVEDVKSKRPYQEGCVEQNGLSLLSQKKLKERNEKDEEAPDSPGALGTSDGKSRTDLSRNLICP